MRLAGKLLNNSGSAATLTLAIKFGGTTLFKGVTGSIAASATAHAVDLELILGSANSTAAQVVAGEVNISGATAPTNGFGSLSTLATNTTGANSSIYGTSTIDTTAAQTFVITGKFSAANANLSIVASYVTAVIEGAGGPVGPTGATGAPISGATNIAVVSTLPGTPDSNTLYIVTG